MKAYFSVLKLRLINSLQYRAAAFAGIVTQFFWGFIVIMIYQAFYQNARTAPPLSLPQVVSYVWLQEAFLVLIMLWVRDQELFNLITSGNMAYELCRPCGLYGYWYAKLLAQRISGALLRCIPILFIAFLLPRPYRIMAPPDLAAFGLFIVTLMLGMLVLVAISMFIYLSVFITMSPAGSSLIFSTVGEFFSGMIIPVPLMPLWLQRVAYLLPFRVTADLPFRVYSGQIPPQEALFGILTQLGWLILLITLGNITLKKALRRVVIQGG